MNKKRKLLSTLLMLCMVFGMLPGTTAKASYLIQVSDFEYLQAAVGLPFEEYIIRLVDSIDLGSNSLNINNTNNFTLDLNGNTLSSSSDCTIYYYGAHTLTITDSTGNGNITGSGASGTIRLGDGSNLCLTGGTVEATAGKAIQADVPNNSNISIPSGMVTIKGSTGAMNKAPDLSSYGSYLWRTSSTGVLTSSTTIGYNWSLSDTYVEIQPYIAPISSTPTATVTTIQRLLPTSIEFVLNNDPSYTSNQIWKVYTEPTGDTLAPSVTATNISNLLMLNHPTELPFGTYYVSVTESGKTESARLALTVAAIPGAPTIGTAVAGNGQASVSFAAPASDGGSAITGYTVTSSPGGFSASSSVSPITVTGLTNGTSYTFTVTATNVIGTGSASSPSNTVTPGNKPTVTTTAATSLTRATATLNGTVNANGLSTNAWFEYGPTSGYGNSVNVIPGTVTGYSDTPVSCEITGLEANTIYHYRVVAQNSLGIEPGVDQTFTTLDFPKVTAANISVTGATGTGGTFRIGDTVTASWNNSSAGDNNSDTISSVMVDFSAFGGNTAVAATNSGGIWTATYTIDDNSSFGTNKNVAVTVTDNAGNETTTTDTTNTTVIMNETVSHLDLTGKLTAPVKSATPSTTAIADAQYTGTVSWNGNPTKFLGNTAYTATVTLTAKTGYTFAGVTADAFIYTGTTGVSNAVGSGDTMTVTIVFSATAERTLQSIAITAPPTKMEYKHGESFSNVGMVVKATYDDGSENTDFTNYTVDKTILIMNNNTVTLTADGTSVSATQAITVIRADGPAVSGVAAVGCTNTHNNDGKLTGVTGAMQYKKDGAADYTDGNSDGSDITGLTNGIYLVRVKATSTHNAGADSTISVGAYVAPTPGSGNSGNNGNDTPTKKEGKIEKDQKKDENAPSVNLMDSTEDLKSKLLSTQEQAQVAAGKDAKVILKIEDISASISAEDKKKIEEKLITEQQNTAEVALLYIDISLYKKVGDEAETRVTETNGNIKISIEVPKSMRSTESGADRTYRVIRMHNGVAEVLEGTYDPTTHLFTFETDRFSTYALTYQDERTTPDQNNTGTSDQLTVYEDFNHLRLTAKAAKTSQKLSYAEAMGADGYIIYGAKCGQELKELAEVDATITVYTVKKLKQATYYKYQVKAYKLIDGEKVIFMTSKVIHSVTEGKTYANPTKVTMNVSSITLSEGESKTVIGKVQLPKDKKMKEHTAVIRYVSTNKEVATVNSKGKITAKAEGICYVYAYAQNGVNKKIKIIVE